MTEIRHRTLTLDVRKADQGKREIPAVLSSETPVKRWGEVEILSHAPDAVDLSRAAGNGVPLLFGHDQRDLVGRVRDVRLDGDKLRGVVFIGNSPRSNAIWQDIADGVLSDLSIGYSVDKIEDIDGGYRATRWTLMETSLVSVPADSAAGLFRNHQSGELLMTDTKKQVANQGEPMTREAFQAAEKTRRFKIRQIFQAYSDRENVAAAMNSALDDPQVDEHRARELLLEELGRGAEPLNDYSHRITPSFDLTRGGDFGEAVTDAILLRAGSAVQNAHPWSRQLAAQPLIQMMREFMLRRGVRADELTSPQEIYKRSMSTSDFPNLLANTMNKSLLVGFQSDDVGSHRMWTRTGSINDFKTASRTAMSEMPSLNHVPEGGEYAHGAISDYGVQFKLKTYGSIVRLTRHAIINDDLSAFASIPRGMGLAAGRLESDLAYAILTDNDLMGDGIPLFDNAHNNISVGAMDIQTLADARAKMRSQTGIGGTSILNIQPAYLIVPSALETEAEQLLASMYVPTTAANAVPALFRGLQIVADARLDQTADDVFYLAASPNAVDTVEIAGLQGQPSPVSEQQQDFGTDNMSFKVRLDVGAVALDYRGLVRVQPV